MIPKRGECDISFRWMSGIPKFYSFGRETVQVEIIPVRRKASEQLVLNLIWKCEVTVRL